MKKGSIMIYVLIVLSMLLIISFAVISVNNSQTRSAIDTDESVVAFFVAESGAEVLIDRIYSDGYNARPLEDLSGGSCDSGVLSGITGTGTWTATFFDTNRNKLTDCNDTGWRGEVNEIKIDGNHSSTIRSIRTSIKPSG